jgi:hypothetical protein
MIGMRTDNILLLNFTGEKLVFDINQKGKVIKHYKEYLYGIEGIYLKFN